MLEENVAARIILGAILCRSKGYVDLALKRRAFEKSLEHGEQLARMWEAGARTLLVISFSTSRPDEKAVDAADCHDWDGWRSLLAVDWLLEQSARPPKGFVYVLPEDAPSH